MGIVLSAGSRSVAQPNGAPALASASASSSAPAPLPALRGPALQRAARMLARDIAPSAAGAVVVGTALVSDVPAPRGAELVARAVSLLAGALGPEVRVGTSPATIESARAESPSALAIVVVQTAVFEGELRLTADVFPVPHNLWDRSRNPYPGPIAHGFGSARIDGEVRSHLAPVPLVASQTLKATLPEPEVLALLCDDIDSDGALEIVIAARRSIATGRVRGGQFEVLRKVAWDTLSPIAPSPWRQPLLSMSMPSPGILDVGSTDRARAVRLGSSLEVQGPIAGLPVPLPQGDGCAPREAGVLGRELAACDTRDGAPAVVDVGFAFDATAAAEVVHADGTAAWVWAARKASDGSVLLRDTAGRSVSAGLAGAQLALADLDFDGDPELMSSRNVLEASEDVLTVRTWRASGSLQDRFTVHVNKGIGAVAACPGEGSGMRTIAVVAGNELWLIR